MRRMIASMLCALLLLQAVPFAMAQSTPIAMLTPAKAAPGEEFTMTVRLSDWPAMKAMYIAPEYDDTVLILTSGVWLKDGMVTENWSQVYGDAVFAAAQSMDLNGEVFTLTFRVKETAAVKKSVAVTCNFIIQGEQNGQDVTESLRIAAAVDIFCRHGDKQ